jgi:hypothetical protein
MQHEKIIKDGRGTVTIIVKLVTFNYRMRDAQDNEFRYDVSVSVKAPRKKNEVYDISAATDVEIWSAKMELWEKLKP